MRETIVQLDLVSDRPLEPRLGHCEGAEAARLTVESMEPARRPLLETRLRLVMNDRGRSATCSVSLGGMPRAASVLATVDRSEPERALICGLPPAGWDVFGPHAPNEATVFVGLDRALLGSGWGEVGDAGPLGYRAITADAAELVLSLARVREAVVSVRARGPSGSALALEVNGVRFKTERLAGDWSTIAWPVPLASAQVS